MLYLSHLGKLQQNGKVEKGVCEQLQMQEAYLYHDGILKLVPTWYKCTNLLWLCGEKWYVNGKNQLH